MKSNSFRIAVMPGEGIGVEVMGAALTVLEAVETRFGIACKPDPIPGGAHHYNETGRILPEDGMTRAGQADALITFSCSSQRSVPRPRLAMKFRTRPFGAVGTLPSIPRNTGIVAPPTIFERRSASKRPPQWGGLAIGLAAAALLPLPIVARKREPQAMGFSGGERPSGFQRWLGSRGS
jgi:hypothetical protein